MATNTQPAYLQKLANELNDVTSVTRAVQENVRSWGVKVTERGAVISGASGRSA